MKAPHQAPDSQRIYLVLLVGFFIGIFIATLDVGASTIFLNRFDEQAYLPKAMLASGILGVILTYLFAYLQNRLPFLVISAAFVLLILITLTSIRLWFGWVSNTDLLVFGAFICVGPMNALMFLIFWGLYGRIFNLKESKKLIGRIDSGQLVASIIALFTIPFILTFIHEPVDLLWISCVSIAIIFFMLLYTNWKYTIDRNPDRIENAHMHTYASMAKNKYIVWMAVFANVSMICIYFLNYSFLAVTADQFPDPRHLANFISICSGTIIIFNFLIQNFVTDRLINMYGLKVSLLINPVLLCLFTVISATIGSYMGYTRQSENFLLFFIAITLGKVFATSLKDALDSPTFKLYFLPLDSSVRFDIQAKIEGVVTMFAGVIAGSLLWLLDTFAVIDLIFFTYFLIPIIFCWLLIINKLYGSYRNALEKTLESIKVRKHATVKKEQVVDEILKSELRSDRPEQVIHALKLIERIDPALLESVLKDVRHIPFPTVQAYAQERINSLSLYVESKPDTNSDFSADVHTRASSDSVEGQHIHANDTAYLVKLVRSNKVSDKILALQILSKAANADHINLLIELLRNQDVVVKRAAMAVARKHKFSEAWPIWIDLLNWPAYSFAASAALVEAGTSVLPALELAFHKSGQSTGVLLKIIKIYGRIGGEKAIKLLWNKIDYPDPRIVSQVLASLSDSQSQPMTEKSPIVFGLLEQELSKAAWNQSALLEIADAPYNRYLKAALEEEMSMNFDRIFILLSLIYNPPSIQLVKENIESGTHEGRVYALELLDVFIDKSIKPILFPLLDDTPAKEEINIYQEYFLRETLNAAQVLVHIINREYTSINRWTRACAMYSLTMMPGVKVTNDLIAHIFNPDLLLRQTAAWAIHTIDPATFSEVTSRINDQVKGKLHTTYSAQPADSLARSSDLMLEKILFLQQIPVFSGIPGMVLSELADTIKPISFSKGQTVISKGQADHMPVYVIVQGRVVWHQGREILLSIGEKELIGELLVVGQDMDSKEATAVDDTIVYSLNKEKFYQVMARYPKLVQNFIQTIHDRSSLDMAGIEEEYKPYSNAG
jgi:hypothetical protein